MNSSSKALILTPAFYVFCQASQFVNPGAKVLTTTGSNDALAFNDPDGTIVVVMNNSGAAKTAVVAIGSTKVSFALPDNGFATVNWKPEVSMGTSQPRSNSPPEKKMREPRSESTGWLIGAGAVARKPGESRRSMRG